MKIQKIQKLLLQWRSVIIITLFHFAYLVITGCSSGNGTDDRAAIVFKDVTVIDAVNGLRTGQSVVVSGNRIVEAGPKKEVRKPSGATVIDCKGKYLIPGLWDAHMHLTNNSALYPVMYPLIDSKWYHLYPRYRC